MKFILILIGAAVVSSFSVGNRDGSDYEYDDKDYSGSDYNYYEKDYSGSSSDWRLFWI